MTEPGRIAIETYPIPIPGTGEVLLEMVRANVCGSELHIWQGHDPQARCGCLGHEGIGRIAALGEGVQADNSGSPLKLGDLVSFTFAWACHHCRACVRGEFNQCENAHRWWTMQPEDAPHFHATFATHYIVHPGQHMYKVPEGISEYAAASANCAVSQVIYGLDSIHIAANAWVVIQGLGGLGLFATAAAAFRGAKVIAIDLVDERLEFARRFGATQSVNLHEHDPQSLRELVRARTNGYGADFVMNVTGSAESLSSGVMLVRPGGTVLEMGVVSPGYSAAIDPGLMTRHGLTLRFIARYQPWYLHKALNFLHETRHLYPYRDLESRAFGLSQVADALNSSARREVFRASIVL